MAFNTTVNVRGKLCYVKSIRLEEYDLELIKGKIKHIKYKIFCFKSSVIYMSNWHFNFNRPGDETNENKCIELHHQSWPRIQCIRETMGWPTIKNHLLLSNFSKCNIRIWHQDNEIFPLLSSSEHEIVPLINIRMPTIAGFLKFISRISFMLSWIEQDNKLSVYTLACVDKTFVKKTTLRTINNK